MRVEKRDGTTEQVSFDKVSRRIEKLCDGLAGIEDPHRIAQDVCARIYDGVKTSELDELAAQMCSSMVTIHPDYGILAARIFMSNHHKNTSPSFSETMSLLYHNVDGHGNPNPLISEELWSIVQASREKLNAVIDYDRDYEFSYFGMKTLERSYLMRVNGRVVERPQHLWMRVALGIHGGDIKDAIETYDLMSRRMFTHATPTLFNAGTPRASLASCYLLALSGDSIQGIFKSVADSAMISKYAGGIGIHMHDLRSRGAYIRGTNGVSSGIVPFLRIFNNTALAVNQSGRRAGSIAVYMEPWHADIEAFLELRKNQGNEEERCRDLFTALWVPDLFMRRVEANEEWSLMDPDECPGLSDVYGEEFEALYTRYEGEGRARRRVKAQLIWTAVLRSQVETGTPYVMFKDAVNRKSNQKNLGTIKSSNLCVAPETKILTDKGYEEIQRLEGKDVRVWNGLEWSDVRVAKTGEDQELIKVSFSDGSVLQCTPYHKFYIQEGYLPEGFHDDVLKSPQVRIVEAKDLTASMQLVSWRLPNEQADTCVQVVSIERTGRRDDTFCVNEPKRHAVIFNGIMTGNCSEITLYSTPDEYAVCNLASISLPAFVRPGPTPVFDFDALHRIAGVITRNLNKVIDRTFYPVPETERSNRRHRPIGMGVQGLADVFAMMRLPFDSDAAADLNRRIFATIYHGALVASCGISRQREQQRDELDRAIAAGDTDAIARLRQQLAMIPEEEALATYRGAYMSFDGSPTSRGELQFDLWGITEPETVNGMLDWDGIKEDIRRWGLRNSMLLALMPTASTAQILGNNESFEPFTSNIYQRRTLAGEHLIINQHLVKDLLALGLWTPEVKNKILVGGGSIQHIQEIPADVRALYKTAWELRQKVIIDQAADRGPYICQAQSLNLFSEEPDFNKMTNMAFYGWRRGAKNAVYYLRTRPKAKTAAFTIEPVSLAAAAGSNAAAAAPGPTANGEDAEFVCRRDDPNCLMCSS